MTSKRQKLARLENRADRFERVVAAALRRAIRAGTRGLGVVASGGIGPELLVTPEMAARWRTLTHDDGPVTIAVPRWVLDRIQFVNSPDVSVVAAIGPEPAEPYVSLDDLAAIETAWQQELRDNILPQLGRTLTEGANDAIEDLVSKAPVLVDGRSAISESYLMQADNRLRGIGSDLWRKTRAQLVTGMADGESIPELTKRVRGELASSTVRARTIARTEVIGASNAGAFMQVTAMGEDAPETKVWLATGDRRTRLSHRAADGQKVPLNDNFQVGSSALMFPGDPRGAADEVVNCRCTLTWDFEPISTIRIVDATADVDQVARAESQGLTAAAGEIHTSAMVALIPAEPRFIDGGEPAEESHLTLWFLGDVSEIPPDAQAAMTEKIRFEAKLSAPIEANAFGLAVWNLDGDDPCLVLNVGGPGLWGLREGIHAAINQTERMSDWQMPAQHQPWAPHMCLGYGDPLGMFESGIDQLGPVVFDRVRVAFGNEVHDIPLGGGE